MEQANSETRRCWSASELGRVLFTQDDDLLTEATRRQHRGQPFGGVIYAHQLRNRLSTAFVTWNLSQRRENRRI